MDRAVPVGNNAENGLPDDAQPRSYVRNEANDGNVDPDVPQRRANAFRNYQVNLGHPTLAPDAQEQFLQDIHKAIAKKRITMYLDNHGGRVAMNVDELPPRTNDDFVTAGGDGQTIAFVDGQNYQNYSDIIDNADYNEDAINGFVVELCRKVSSRRAFYHMKFPRNRIDLLTEAERNTEAGR